MNKINWKSFVFGGASILGGISEKITKFTNIVGISKQNDAINDVLFYGAEGDKEKKELGLNNLFSIYYLIVHASRTIDMCVPTLDSETISKCLINTHQKNHVRVRIIVHSKATLKSLQSFIESGIEVKVISPKIKLEHEFLLIDVNYQDTIAIVGSLDYEVNRVNHNRDSTLLTSEATLIKALKREFDRIWNIQSDQVDQTSSQKTHEIEEKANDLLKIE
ncbi:unnamed protein product, partial [Brenthis ino]